MNLGLRKMQISRAAVPPKRMRPIQLRSGPDATAPGGSAVSAATMLSMPTPREPFTSTVSPSASSPGSTSPAARESSTLTERPGKLAAIARASGPTVRRRSTPRSPA